MSFTYLQYFRFTASHLDIKLWCNLQTEARYMPSVVRIGFILVIELCFPHSFISNSLSGCKRKNLMTRPWFSISFVISRLISCVRPLLRLCTEKPINFQFQIASVCASYSCWTWILLSHFKWNWSRSEEVSSHMIILQIRRWGDSRISFLFFFMEMILISAERAWGTPTQELVFSFMLFF